MSWPTSEFPSLIDDIADQVDSSDDVAAADINGAYDCIEKLEAKVGVNSSGVVTSLDYLLSNTSSVDPGHKHSLASGISALTASRAVVTNGSGAIIVSDVTAAELAYLDGLDSNIQDQIDGVSADLIDDTTPQLGGDLDTNEKDILVDTGHGIQDESGNNQLRFSTTATAVNDITIKNAATGNAPQVQATGTDTNIDCKLIPKGTGVLSVSGTTNYEDNVSADDDIPNKKWVDDQGYGTGSVDISGTPVANDFAKFTDADTVAGRSYAEVRSDLNIADGADVTASNSPQAHKNSHDPEDGSDALDCAAPSELASVQAAAEGSSHSLARADHAHQIQHSIADNHLVTIDGAAGNPNDDEYARFTTNGLEGRTYAQVKSDLDLEAGTDFYSKSAEDTWRNSVTQTEMGYLNGVSSDIQTQVNAKGDMDDVVDDTTPQLGGNLDLNEKGIAYDFGSLASDHTYSGDVITGVAGENVVIGDICYLKSDGKFWQMDSNVEAEVKGMCVMATSTINAAASGVFLIRGLIRDDTWTWTVGASLWAPETDGNPTETQPSDSGDFVRLIGWAKAADYIWFDPDKTYVEVE